jgi:hypothetical protein
MDTSAGFEDEDLELQATLQASLAQRGSDRGTRALSPAPGPNIGFPWPRTLSPAPPAHVLA